MRVTRGRAVQLAFDFDAEQDGRCERCGRDVGRTTAVEARSGRTNYWDERGVVHAAFANGVCVTRTKRKERLDRDAWVVAAGLVEVAAVLQRCAGHDAVMPGRLYVEDSDGRAVYYCEECARHVAIGRGVS